MTRRQVFQATTAAGAAALTPHPLRSEAQNVYTRIGVRPFINLTATYTINGGTLILPEVRQAMDEASRFSVNIDELMDKVGERIANLLGSEAAVVTSGCAAALAHATAACLTGGDPEKIQRLPAISGPRDQVIMPKQSRNMYDHAFRMSGAQIVMVDAREEYIAALGERTALVAVLGTGEAQGKVRLEEMAAAARKAKVPVLVDAAAELPLKPNPYLSRGADLVTYSGGKILRGPQCAGLLLGRKDLVRAAWISGAPHHGFGRPMKVGKEEIMGMLAAIEAWTHSRSIHAEYRTWEEWLNHIGRRITQIAGVEAKVVPPAGASPFPVLAVSWDAARIRITAGELGRQLLAGEPRIMSHAEGEGSSFVIRPAAMQPGQQEPVAERLSALLQRAKDSAPTAHRRGGTAVPDISGEWIVAMHYAASDALHRFHLVVHEGEITGSHRTPHLEGAIRGWVEDGRIRLASSMPFEGTQLSYEFSGEAGEAGMSGEVSFGEYGGGRWTARRG